MTKTLSANTGTAECQHGTCYGPTCRLDQPVLTNADIEAGYENEDWQGWGYLGGRQQLTDAERTSGDAQVLAYANAHDWTAERLFTWLNSRPGRHFADDMTLGSRHAELLLSADLS